MRVLQDDASTTVVVPYEEANSPGECFPTAAEAPASTFQSAQVSTQICIQPLYGIGLLLPLGNNMSTTVWPHQFLVHSQSVRTIAIGLWQSLHKLLHRYPTSFLHHITTDYQTSFSSYRHHYICLPLFLPMYVNSSSTSTVSVGVWSSTRSGRVS